MKKLFNIILLLIIVYAVCKWPDKVVTILEWGFVKVKGLIAELASSTPQ